RPNKVYVKRCSTNIYTSCHVLVHALPLYWPGSPTQSTSTRSCTMNPIKFGATALAATALLAACSGDSAGPSVAGRQVAFQLATNPAPAGGLAALAGQEVIAVGSDTIVLTSVQMVLREIELKRVGGIACDTAEVEDDCGEMEIDAPLLDLPP